MHVSYRLIFPEKRVVSNSVNWRVISIRVFIRLSNLNTFPTGNNVSFLQEILFRKWEAGKPWHKCHTETTATGSVGLEDKGQKGWLESRKEMIGCQTGALTDSALGGTHDSSFIMHPYKSWETWRLILIIGSPGWNCSFWKYQIFFIVIKWRVRYANQNCYLTHYFLLIKIFEESHSNLVELWSKNGIFIFWKHAFKLLDIRKRTIKNENDCEI